MYSNAENRSNIQYLQISYTQTRKPRKFSPLSKNPQKRLKTHVNHAKNSHLEEAEE